MLEEYKSEDFSEDKIPAISVIIPIYNRGNTVKRCIESVLNQNFSDFELILVDDGSTDDSLFVCRQYEQRDSRIRVCSKQNGGASSARNEGIRIAKGKYITFIDSDDYIDDGFLKEGFDVLEKNHQDLFISGMHFDIIDAGELVSNEEYKLGKDSQEYSTKDIFAEIGVCYHPGCLYAPYCKMYRRKDIVDNQIFFDETISRYEDVYFNVLVLGVINRIWFSNRVFYHYCQDKNNSLYNSFQKNYYECYLKSIGAIDELITKLHVKNSVLVNTFFPALSKGLHEHFVFYEKTTDKDILIYLKKFAKDPIINKYGIKAIKGIKNKLLFVLIKLRMHRLILFCMKKHYNIKGCKNEKS